jgi:hypothetical protein
VLEVRQLREEIDQLKAMLVNISKAVNAGSGEENAANEGKGKGKEEQKNAQKDGSSSAGSN